MPAPALVAFLVAPVVNQEPPHSLRAKGEAVRAPLPFAAFFVL
jgi:hypothetical protein